MKKVDACDMHDIFPSVSRNLAVMLSIQRCAPIHINTYNQRDRLRIGNSMKPSHTATHVVNKETVQVKHNIFIMNATL